MCLAVILKLHPRHCLQFKKFISWLVSAIYLPFKLQVHTVTGAKSIVTCWDGFILKFVHALSEFWLRHDFQSNTIDLIFNCFEVFRRPSLRCFQWDEQLDEIFLYLNCQRLKYRVVLAENGCSKSKIATLNSKSGCRWI